MTVTATPSSKYNAMTTRQKATVNTFAVALIAVAAAGGLLIGKGLSQTNAASADTTETPAACVVMCVTEQVSGSGGSQPVSAFPVDAQVSVGGAAVK